MYSPRQVAAGAFLGSPIAGSWLLASNYAVIGDLDARRRALLWGVLSTVAVFVLALVLPERFPNSVVPITYTYAIYALAKSKQGQAFSTHLAAGGRRHSSWRVAGIGLLFLVVVFLLVLGVVMALPEGLLVE